jgi:glycosyltransferase involved in cell wall biosynthesis
MASRRLPLTLVLVSFQKADVIQLAIRSVAAGSMRPDLVVLSDDGSADGTPDLAEAALQAAGLPYRILRHLRVAPYRLQTMRNAAIANALDGVVVMSDSDCLFGYRSLESHYAIHEVPMRVGPGPRYEFLEGKAGPFGPTFFTLEASHFPEGTYVDPVGANTSFRKSLWRLIGGFDRIYEGSYGMDEFEFSLRAQKAGATCYSDPGAYIFHVPHDTIFGGRSAAKNIRVFDRNFGKDHLAHEWFYLARRVIPWYLRGNRKQPLLGSVFDFDEWGAPPGFVAPPHFSLSRTRRLLLEPVERLLERREWKCCDAIWKVIAPIDLRLIGQTTPAATLIGELRWALQNLRELDALLARLERWRAALLAFEDSPEPKPRPRHAMTVGA